MDVTPATAATVNEVLLAFLRHAAQHYRRPDGTTTNELVEFKLVCRALRELHGHSPAHAFGPLALKAACRASGLTDTCGTCSSASQRDQSHESEE